MPGRHRPFAAFLLAVALAALLPHQTHQDEHPGLEFTTEGINTAAREFRLFLDPALEKGVRMELLEDSPGRPVTSTGDSAVPLDPAPWWFSSERVAPPSLVVRIYGDSGDIRMFCPTVGARIVYTMGLSAGDLEDPSDDGLTRKGIFFNGRPVRFTKSTAFKAIAVHPDAKDSAVIASGLIELQLDPPRFSVYQGVFNGSVRPLPLAPSRRALRRARQRAQRP